MEFDLLFKVASAIIGSLLGNLLFGSGSPEQATQKKVQDQVRSPVVVERKVALLRPHVPSFFTSVPSGHFVGISGPMSSLVDARKSAVNDVVRQVLSSIGGEYSHEYVDFVSGNVRNPQRKIEDRLCSVSSGVVLGVERNIVKSSWYRDSSGRYLYFVLVRYTEENILEMRRLSRGAKIMASVVSENEGDFRLTVSEVNGVSVMISSADVKITKRNRFSKFFSFCVWHVPEGSEHTVSVALEPLKVRGNSQDVVLSMAVCKKGFKDYLLGAKFERVAVLRGYDELGRSVSVRIVI